MAERKNKGNGPQWRRVMGENLFQSPWKSTNKEFAETKDFQESCRRANGVNPTTRQASKYRNKKGSAWKNDHNLLP